MRRRGPALPQINAMLNAADIQVIDFFCGCGGTSAGLRAAGMQILAAVDCDREAGLTYARNFPEARFFDADIRRLPADTFDEQVDPQRPLLVSACAPCQPYSTFRRKSRRTREDRTLLLRLLPFLEHLRPEVVLVENVPGMQKVPGRSTWTRFISALGRLGYAVDWSVVDCRAYGVPQRRRRLVLLASRIGSIAIPTPSHGRGLRPFSTIGEWIGDLSPLEAGESDPVDPDHRASALRPLNLARIRALRPGGSREQWPAELWLTCHRGFDGHEDVYGRMAFDACAPVLTTKCTSISNGRFGHPTQDRAISLREAACLQTFPRSFRFEGGMRSATRQVGNAVPVLLAQRLGDTIVEHIASAVMAER